MKKVSIIIACYNHAEFLKQAFNSAINQDYPNLEVIIANDGSTDNSLEVANSFNLFPNAQVISHENKGVVFARNNAIKNSTGDYIIPLDADDYFASNNIISKMVAKLEEEKADLIFGNAKYFGKCNNILIKKNKGFSSLLIENFIFVTSLFTRKIFDKVGGFSDKMQGGYEDWELFIRIANKGKIHKIEETIFFYRTHNTSRNIEAEKKIADLFNQCVLNNKEIYVENIASIVSNLRENITTLKQRIKSQKKIRKFITYFALAELVLIMFLILR